MVDEKPEKSRLSLSKPGKLGLKRSIESGQVRQNFSHGRSKVVTVEVRKKRTFSPIVNDPAPEITDEIPVDDPQTSPEISGASTDEARPLTSDSGQNLTDQERAVRASALQESKRVEGKGTLAESGETISDATEEDELTASNEASEESGLGDSHEAEVRRREEEAESLEREKRGNAAAEAGVAKLKEHQLEDGLNEEAGPEEAEKSGKGIPKKTNLNRRKEPRRRSGKLTIANALDETERVRSLASVRRAREKRKKREGPIEHIKVIRDVVVPEEISVQELSNRMAERVADVVKILMKMGVMSEAKQLIDADTAELVATEFGHKVKRVTESDLEDSIFYREGDDAILTSRPPVVTVMGHVDHGKTSLLDSLRESNMISTEAGGITQHIGAYQVVTEGGKKVTFIDTPGHEAFTEMRSRGAKFTDIIVLVVAADDGIMPQTVESINHAKAAGVPIIVAVNKIDVQGSDPNRVRTQLLEHEVVCEAMGGDVLDVEVSALKKTNLNKLIDSILLQAEILDLKVNNDRPSEGRIVESRLESSRGAVATVLVQHGTLKIGDVFVAGSTWGKVRKMTDDKGTNIKSAGPSTPVEVVGFNAAPQAGEDFVAVGEEGKAREISGLRDNKERQMKASLVPRGTLDELFTAIQSGESKELQLIVKADVQGSVEAIVGLLKKMPQEEVAVKILHQGVGGVNESDVQLAKTTGALIIGFNVRSNKQARSLAESENIDIRYYSVIYELADDVKGILVGLMTPELKEQFLGNAEIREVFTVSRVGKVAGCYVLDGVVKRGAGVRLIRDNVVLHQGELSTLRRFKDDVREVQQNYECGMSFESYNDIKVGDVIECFDVEEVTPTI